MEKRMDRRQRKTREAIFGSFTELLSKKDFGSITVGEIIEGADVGRATFYAHFETKDFLLKELCGELFCHIFDIENDTGHGHSHIFECEGSKDVFLHLFSHLEKNDNNIMALLSSHNNELFLKYFRDGLDELVEKHLHLFSSERSNVLPRGYLKNHIVSTFVETVKWWIENGGRETPEKITEYFFAAVG